MRREIEKPRLHHDVLLPRLLHQLVIQLVSAQNDRLVFAADIGSYLRLPGISMRAAEIVRHGKLLDSKDTQPPLCELINGGRAYCADTDDDDIKRLRHEIYCVVIAEGACGKNRFQLERRDPDIKA